MTLEEMIPEAWKELLAGTIHTESFRELSRFIEEEYSCQQIFPPYENIFHALKLTPPEKLKVLLLGQDPYHEEGQAQGLAFSVRPGVKFPASLRNIFKEYSADTGFPVPDSGSLIPWAEQGVLLLNTVLTVRAHEANSHKDHGWEEFTDAVISAVNSLPHPVIFVLWGGPAQKKMSLIGKQHTVICSAHPSPLSAYRGFFGSRPFSKINAALQEKGLTPVDWEL